VDDDGWVPPSRRQCSGTTLLGKPCTTVLNKSNKTKLCGACTRRAEAARRVKQARIAKEREPDLNVEVESKCARGCGFPRHRGMCGRPPVEKLITRYAKRHRHDTFIGVA
jgi:hypothetical protein